MTQGTFISKQSQILCDLALGLLGSKKTYSISTEHFSVYNFFKQNVGTVLDGGIVPKFGDDFVRGMFEMKSGAHVRRRFYIAGSFRVYFNSAEEQMSFLLKWS